MQTALQFNYGLCQEKIVTENKLGYGTTMDTFIGYL